MWSVGLDDSSSKFPLLLSNLCVDAEDFSYNSPWAVVRCEIR